MGRRLRNGHLDNAKIKVQSAKLRNPGLAGMGVLVVASFSISRSLYLLDIYYTPSEVGRQGKSPITAEAEVDTEGTTDDADSRRLLTTNWHELPRNGRRGHREKDVSGYQEGEPPLDRVERPKISKSPPTEARFLTTPFNLAASGHAHGQPHIHGPFPIL